MRPVSDWDENHLNELIKVGEKESLGLDYKASASLAKNDKEKNDISKDVSAFANSAGGIIVYGMLEDKHVPIAIDVGSNPNEITKEWLESVIIGRIHPAVDNVVIKQINVPSKGENKVVYAVEISAATSRAPHQAYDHRYYKRYNFQSIPMEDYEVRDLMRRSIDYGKKYGAAWDLNVEIQRLTAAIDERCRLQNSDVLPRARLIIGVSSALRSAGNAIVLLEKPVREKVAMLIKKVDGYNAKIETVDPGQREEARVNDRLRAELAAALTIGEEISRALALVLEREP